MSNNNNNNNNKNNNDNNNNNNNNNHNNLKHLSFTKLKCIVQELQVKSTNKNTVFITKCKHLGRPRSN